jgi:pSer/pThr/pTyr-binding forkhead associated (FHA) protein
MRLLGRTGQLTGRTVAVTGAMRIGRAPENELQISVDGVSRQHARLVPENDGFVLEDLNSANGTFLNGVRITKERLAHLDVITFGRLADLIVDARASAPAASPVAGEAFLEALDGPEDGSRLVIPPGELTIGRVPPSNVLIDSRVVSKLHARLRRTSDRLAVDDLDSPNGTFVNGARITTNHTLADGDTISIAGIRSFRVRLSATGGGAAAPPPVVHVVPAAPTVVAPADAAPPAFSQEWKTRLVWSADELSAVEKERERIVEEVRRSTGGLPGTGATSMMPPAPAPAPPSVAPAATARKTEFMKSGDVPIPPEFAAADAPPPPPAPPASAVPSTPAAAGAVPPTSSFRPGADLPPVFAEAPPPEPVAAAPTAPALLCLQGAAGTFVLTPGEHVVGRQEGVSIYIADRQVSRAHAVVTVSGGTVTIEDRASANGTFVNGERLSAPRAIAAGDEVRFGDLRLSVIARP